MHSLVLGETVHSLVQVLGETVHSLVLGETVHSLVQCLEKQLSG